MELIDSSPVVVQSSMQKLIAQATAERLARGNPVFHRPPNPAMQSWGDWLGGLAEWKWFLTLTFRDPAYVPGENYSQVGNARVNRAWDWTVAQWTTPLHAPTWVRCFETQPTRGVLHIHALLAETEAGSRWATFSAMYWTRYGFNKVLQYEKDRGAAYYLCKYVVKDLGDIKFSPLLSASASTGAR